MLSSILAKTTCIKPFVGSLSESTQVRYRWYKDMLENKRLKRTGYRDQTKQEGPLPRLRDDSMPLTVLPSYKAKNSWAEHKALAGQNDYIDILGSDEIHPKQIMYHVPHYLRGIHKNDNYFKMTIKRPGEGSETLPLTRYPRFLAVHFICPRRRVHRGKQESGRSVRHGGGCALTAKCFVIDW